MTPHNLMQTQILSSDVFRQHVVPSLLTNPHKVCEQLSEGLKTASCSFLIAEGEVIITDRHGNTEYAKALQSIFECESTGEIITGTGWTLTYFLCCFQEHESGDDLYILDRDKYNEYIV